VSEGKGRFARGEDADCNGKREGGAAGECSPRPSLRSCDCQGGRCCWSALCSNGSWEPEWLRWEGWLGDCLFERCDEAAVLEALRAEELLLLALVSLEVEADVEAVVVVVVQLPRADSGFPVPRPPSAEAPVIVSGRAPIRGWRSSFGD